MTIHPLNIRTVLEGDAPVLDFVLPGLTAKAVGTIVGPGGVGKTTLLLQVAMALATNTPAADGLFASGAGPCRVVLLAAEESADILRIRLHAIHRWMTHVQGQASLLVSGTAENALSLLEKNLQLLPASGQSVFLLKDGAPTAYFESLCTFCQGTRLIVIDPLRRLHDGDENSSTAMTAIVQLLELLGNRTGAAVLVVHHMSKNAVFMGASESAAASRGSSALTDAVRWQLNLSQMTEAESKAFGLTGQRRSYLRLDFAKTNYIAPQPTIWLKRLEGGVLTRVMLEGDAPSQKNNKQRIKNAERADANNIYI
jgi:RecA-family ATPase